MLVKVLDFGLAKALETATGGRDLELPDADARHDAGRGDPRHGRLHEPGAGAAASAWTDAPTSGRSACVLYEMLSGGRAFGGETLSDTLAAVLLAAPRWEALPPGASPAIRRLLRRCLEKDVRRRLQAIGEARLAIEEEQAGAGSGEVPAAAAPALVGRRLSWALLGVVLGVALASALLLPRPASTPVPAPVVRFSLPAGTEPQDVLEVWGGGALALSPDGRRLVYAAYHEQTTRLYQRPLDQLEALAIPGTEGADARSSLPTAARSGSSPATSSRRCP